MTSRYLAIDLGAESGRVMLGTLEDGRLAIEELSRFSNTPIRDGDRMYWNIPSLLDGIRAGLAKAGALGLEQHLVLGRGQRGQFERGRESALEDALEAIVAALYLDGGLDVAGDFVNRIFADELADPDRVPSIDNPKGAVSYTHLTLPTILLV